MDAFVMEIAGAVIRVHPMYQSTREYCRPYLSDRASELDVFINAEDLAFEQKMLDIEAVEEGLKLRKFTDPFLERAAIQRKVAEYLLSKNTILLHGSTVAVDGRAYLFTAACGTGKSTHTRLWREAFGDRAVMVNDDKPFLKLTDRDVLAYGSPWSGKHGLATNICVPLQGICLLHRGEENRIMRIDPERMIDTLRRQVHAPIEERLLQQTDALVDQLAARVPLWEMACNKELEAALVSHAAMSALLDREQKKC